MDKKSFFLVSSRCSSHYCILSSTTTTFYFFCLFCLCFFLSPVLYFFVTSILYITQLCLLKKTLFIVFLCLHCFIVTSSIFYKGHHFPLCYPSSLFYHCISWGHIPLNTMLLHLLPFFLLTSLFSLYLNIRTLPLDVFYSPTSKVLYFSPPHHLSPYFLHPTIHHPT